MNNLQFKIDIYENLIPDISKYLEDVYKTYKMLYSTVNKLRDRLMYMGRAVIELKHINDRKLQDIFNMVHNINIIDEHMSSIFYVLEHDTVDAVSDMSNSYLLNMREEFSRLILKYNVLSKKSKEYTDIIISDSLNTTKNHSLTDMREMFELYPQAILLYTAHIQELLYNNKPHTAIYKKAVAALENAKRFIFKGDGLPTTNILQRFGLRPLHTNLNVQQLTTKILNVIDRREKVKGGGGDELADIDELCRMKKYGLFVMINIFPNPTSFRFEQLFNGKDIARQKNQGINEEMLIKNTTTVRLNNDTKVPIIEHRILGDTKSNNWFVIRTIDGSNYDIMATGSTLVDKELIDRIIYGHSDVIDYYQSLCNSEFIEYADVPKTIIPKEKLGHINTISGTVTRNIINYIDNTLGQKIPTSLSDIYDIINAPTMGDIIGNDILVLYNNLELKNPELFITFLYNAETLKNELVKSIRIMISKSNIREIIFKEKIKSMIVPSIMNTIRNIVSKTTDKILTKNNDIYERIMIKKIMLNV